MAVEIVIAGEDLNETAYVRAVLKYVDPTLTDDNIEDVPQSYADALQYVYDNYSGIRPIVVFTYSGINGYRYIQNYFYPHVIGAMPYSPSSAVAGSNLPLPTTAIPDTRGIINVSGGTEADGSDWYYGTTLEFTEEANGQIYNNLTRTLSQYDPINEIIQHSATRVRIKPYYITAVNAEAWLSVGKAVRIHLSNISGFANNPNGRFLVTDAYYPDDELLYPNRYVEFEHNLGAGTYAGGGEARTQFMSGATPTAVAKLNLIRKARNCSWWEARQCAQLTKTWTAGKGYGAIDVASAIAYGSLIPADPYLARVGSRTLTQTSGNYTDEYGTVIGLSRNFAVSAQEQMGKVIITSNAGQSASGFGSASLSIIQLNSDLTAYTVNSTHSYVDESYNNTPEFSFQNITAPEEYDFTEVLYIKWQRFQVTETNLQHEETVRTLATITAYNAFTGNLMKNYWRDLASFSTVTGTVTVNVNHVRYFEAQDNLLLIRFDRYTLRLQFTDSAHAEREYQSLRLIYNTINKEAFYGNRTRLYVSATEELRDDLFRTIEDALIVVGSFPHLFVIIVKDGTFPEMIITQPLVIELQEGVVIDDTRVLPDTDNPLSTIDCTIPAGQELWILGEGTIQQQASDNFRGSIRNMGAGTVYINLYEAVHNQGRVIINENGWLRAKINRITNVSGGYTVIDSDGTGNYDIDANMVNTPTGLLFNQDLAPNLYKIHRNMTIKTSSESGVVSPAFNDQNLEYWFVKSRLWSNFFNVIYFFATPPSNAHMRFWDSVLYSEFGDYNIEDASAGEEYLHIHPYGTLYTNRGIYPYPFTLQYGQLQTY